MSGEERLYLAIGELDDVIIKEASLPYRKRLILPQRGISFAASVALVSIVLAGFIGLMPMLEGVKDMAGGAGNAAMPEDYGSSDFSSSYFGAITVLERWEYGISLVLELSSPTDSLDVYLYGSAYDENGNAIHTVCTTNTENSGGFDYVLTPKITVNGIETQKMPTTEGVYEIKLDFSSIKDVEASWENVIYIDGFGNILR